MKKTFLYFAAFIAVHSGYNEAHANEAEEGVIIDEYESDGLVLVEEAKDLTLPYRERRDSTGILIGLSFLPYKPNYSSTSETALSLTESISGTTAMMTDLNVAYKLNSSIGAATLGLIYGYADIKSGPEEARNTATLTKTGVDVMLLADVLFAEPYIVPFIGGSYYQLSISGKDSTGTANASAYNYGFKTGALFQLNALDPSASVAALNEIGLDNSFIGVFFEATGKGDKPNTIGSLADNGMGANLILEF